jgi:hypothetical protein
MSSELSSVGHRSWCSAAECHATTDGHLTHRSRTAVAQSPCGELTISVHVSQDGNEPPTITMTATYAEVGPDHPGEECEIRLDPDLARAVGWMLRTTGRQAGRDHNRTPHA